MQLAIPHAPRKVRFRQVPGAVGRLVRSALIGLGLCALLVFSASFAARWFSKERAFLASAEEIVGTLADVKVRPGEETGRLTVLYRYGNLQRSATGVVTHAEYAEGIGPGAQVRLLVDPRDPDHPREAGFARAQGALLWLVPVALGVGLVLALGLFAFELRRTLRSEVHPLRFGALVWLLPDGPLPDTRREVTFKGSYFREDQRHEVRARGRPGRAPVRNGEKVLAAVVPSKPTVARVVDEDLARELGWIR